MIQIITRKTKPSQEENYTARKTQLTRLVKRFDERILRPEKYKSSAVEALARIIQEVEDEINCLEYRLGYTPTEDFPSLTLEAAKERLK
jgi:hypothetical protein